MAKRELGDDEAKAFGVPGPWKPSAVPGPWKPPENEVRGRELTEEEMKLLGQPVQPINIRERQRVANEAEMAREATKYNDRTAAQFAGLKKGLTAGFSDRIGAAIRAPFTDNSIGGTIADEYAANLAQNRREEDAHAERAPSEWAVGNIGGNFATGMVAAPIIAARAAAALPEAAAAVRALSTTRPIITGAARGIVEGAVQGGIAGAGYSRAPVGSAEFGKDVASGAGTSALAGGAMGTVGGALTHAAKSARGQALQELLTYPTPQHFSRALVKGKTGPQIRASTNEAIKRIDETPGLNSALLNKDLDAAVDAVEAARAKTIEQLQKTYDYATKASKGVPLDPITAAANKVIVKYDGLVGSKEIANKLQHDLELFNDVVRPAGKRRAGELISPDTLREQIRSLQDRAFPQTAPVNRTTASAAQQEMSMAMREAFNEGLEAIVAKNPAAAKAAGALTGDQLRAANRRYGDLETISRALGERTRSSATGRQGLIATVKGAGRQAADFAATQGTRAWGHVIERAEAGSRPYQVVRAVGERAAPMAASTMAGPANPDGSSDPEPLSQSSGATGPRTREGDSAYTSVVRAAVEEGVSREELIKRAAAVGLDEGMADWIHRRFGWRDGRPQP